MRPALPVLLAMIGCSNGGTVTCDPTPQCTSGGQIATCRDGVTSLTSCDDHEACFAGQCAPISCKPSFFFCDGQVADQCDATGTQHTRTDCAQSNAKCVVGATAATCEALACTPSQIYCSPDGSEVRKCAGDGGGWVVVQTCDDPQQRGNHCAGAVCRDRCELTEAQDRSTLGCRFLGSAFDAQRVQLANPQTDLPAIVAISLGGGAPMNLVVQPGSTATIDLGSGAARATSQSLRGIQAISSVPVYLWAYGAPHALHPEHALSTSYLVGLETYNRVNVSVIASADATDVTVKPSTAIDAGGPIAATPAGTPIVRTLNRGEVLTLLSMGTLNGTTVSATAPVVVEMDNNNHGATMPGSETLGRDFVVPTFDPPMIVAREAAVVTTELDGTLMLAAGQVALVQTGQRLSSTAPLLLGVGIYVPPVEQMLTNTFAVGPGGIIWAPSPTVVLAASGQTVDVHKGSGNFATSGYEFLLGPLMSTGPFWVHSMNVPCAYGLAVLP